MEEEDELVPCVTCKKEIPIAEAIENANYGAYEFKGVCDTCADKMDAAIDEMMQEKDE